MSAHDKIMNRYTSELETLFEEKKYTEAILYYKKNQESIPAELMFNLSIQKRIEEGVKLTLDKINIQDIKTDILEYSITQKNDIGLLLIKKMPKSKLFYEHALSQEKYKNYLLSYAAGKGQANVLEYLIEIGFNPKENNSHALGWACSHGNIENVKYLVSHCKLNTNTMIGYNLSETPLVWSIETERLDIIKFLLEQGAKINYFESGVLKATIESQNLEIINLILSYANKDQIEKLNKLNEKKNNQEISLLINKYLLKEELSRNLKDASKIKQSKIKV